jgi:hypothetical protein
LNPRFIGPFEATERVSPVAYRVSLPPDLAGVHNVFHVSTLRKYVHDPLHVVSYRPVQIKGNLTYEEVPVQILDRKDQGLRTKKIPLVKILWRNHGTKEDSWELELDLRNKYPHMFED